MDPDQLASEEASRSGSTLFTRDLTSGFLAVFEIDLYLNVYSYAQ